MFGGAENGTCRAYRLEAVCNFSLLDKGVCRDFFAFASRREGGTSVRIKALREREYALLDFDARKQENKKHHL
jgi:hypothetical protein